MRNFQPLLVAIATVVAGLVVYHHFFASPPQSAPLAAPTERQVPSPDTAKPPELHSDQVGILAKRLSHLEERVEQASVTPAATTAPAQPAVSDASGPPTEQEVDRFLLVMKEVERRKVAAALRTQIRTALNGTPVNLSAAEEDRLLDATLKWRANMHELFSRTPQKLQGSARDTYIVESGRIMDSWRQEVRAAISRADADIVVSALGPQSGGFLNAGGPALGPVQQAPSAPQAPAAPSAPVRAAPSR